MKTMKYLGCLLALVFAGASAFAASWFTVSEGGTWSEQLTWSENWTSINNWNGVSFEATSAQPVATKDSKITTTVKFTAMDPADLQEQDVPEGAKAGLTVVETSNGVYTFYGIVSGAWVPLTGISTLSDLTQEVTVSVELKKVADASVVVYTVGEQSTTGAAIASDTSIQTVEYRGKCDLKNDLAGQAWFNPCAISPSITGIASVKAYDANIEPLKEYALNAIPRGATVNFAFEAANNYSALVKVASYTTTGEAATEAVTWENYVVATQMPTGTDTPSKITVDAAEVATRIAGGAKGGDNYLFTPQDNGQLGWVNYSLGIADDAMIAPTNGAPVEGSVAIDFGVELDVAPGARVTYTVGGVSGQETPNIALADTKTANNKIVDVAMVLTDEGGAEHVISTARVGVMETGKEGPTSGTTFDIVAVPWASFGGDEISVKDLLNTAMLTEGDTLYIWNGSVYDIYTLNASGAWIAGTQTKRDSKTGTTLNASPDPAERKITQGTAIWIERDVKSRIVFAGLAGDVTQAYQANVAAGGDKEATWSLIANPSIKVFNLESITGAVDGDKLIVEDAADPREYEFNGTSWGYWKTKRTKVQRGSKEVWVTSLEWDDKSNMIPAGIGFWYVRSAKAPEFKTTFTDNE